MIRSHDSNKIRLRRFPMPSEYPGMDPVVPNNLEPGWGETSFLQGGLRILQSATKENFEIGR